MLRSRCTGRFPSQDLERTGTLKELSLTSYFSLMTDFFFFLDKCNTGDLLYPDLSQESDIIPHGKLLVEVEWGLAWMANAELLKQMTRSSVERRNAGQRQLTPQGSVLSQSYLFR